MAPSFHAETALPTLYIHHWRAWLPECAGQQTDQRVLTDEKPAAIAVPALLRRRLTPLGRAVCTMLGEMAAHERELPILHASRHGDGHRPLDMLDTLFEGEPLSPTRFGLSVHNAVLGVYSIAFGNHNSIAAIAAAGEEFEALLSEALGYLAEGRDGVMLVLTDSPVPARYRVEDQAPDQPSALLLELSLRPTPGALCMHPTAPNAMPPSSTTTVPTAVITPPRLLDWLEGSAPLVTRTPFVQWVLVPDDPGLSTK